MKESSAVEILKKVVKDDHGRAASIIELFLLSNGYRDLSDTWYEVTKEW